MKFPGIGGKQSYRVSIPKLDGGLNGCDPAEQIDDNQLSDCLNMWWQDGALRTRPGVTPMPDGAENMGTQTAYFQSGGTVDVTENGKPVRKRAVKYRDTGGQVTPVLLMTDYSGKTVKSVIKPNMEDFSCGSVMLLENCGKTYEGMKENGAVAFISALGLQTGNNLVLGETDDPLSEWIDLSSQIYAPLVMVDGKGGGDNAAASGKSYEAFNLLTGAFRCQFTSDGSSVKFVLPLQQLSHNDGETVVVTGRSVNGSELKWTIRPSGDDFVTSDNSQIVNEADGKPVVVMLHKKCGFIKFMFVSEGLTDYPYPALGITNNIEVKAWKTNKENIRRICNMRFCTWFGGNRSGYNGGTRLFAAGNPEYPNVIHWSDLNNPLYFPENNYAYVGDAGTEITALAKQEDKLILFKKNEIYYTQYVAGQSYTAEDILNSQIVDVTAAAASFPITPIHPGVGCDCPHTIQLCSNRLVWATSGRKVYALTGSNQYSENNVRELSRNISRWIGGYTYSDMVDACSADFRGHYVLMIGNDLYLFNYQDSGYIAYVEYVNYSKSQTQIPWTRWKMDCGLNFQSILSDGDRMVLAGTAAPDGVNYRMNAVMGSAEDSRADYSGGSFAVNAQPIACLFQTKTFPFSVPEHRKDIRQLYIGMTIDDASDISAAYITEIGESQDAAHFNKADGNGIIRLTPNMRRVQRFGLRISSAGAISVGALLLKYDVYGGGIR